MFRLSPEKRKVTEIREHHASLKTHEPRAEHAPPLLHMKLLSFLFLLLSFFPSSLETEDDLLFPANDLLNWHHSSDSIVSL